MAVSTTILQEILNFPAGPDLDRLIAHEVMTLPTTEKVPAYSTEMATAWPVVEAMVRRDNLYFGAPHYKNKRQSLPQLGYPEGTECWYCVVNSKVLNKVVICADTAALAICRAALLCIRSTA
jgi:ABA sandwich protein